MSEFEDIDSLIRNIDLDKDVETENEFLTEDGGISSLSIEEEDIYVKCNIAELSELFSLVKATFKILLTGKILEVLPSKKN